MAAKDSTRIPSAQPFPRLHKGDLVISLQEMVERCNPLIATHDPFLEGIHDELIGLVRDRIEEVFERANAPLTVDEVLDRIKPSRS
jgi:hypothetical protein